MCCTNILGCTIVIAGIVAGILCVVGLAIPIWNSNKGTTTSVMVSVKQTTWEGLWQKCTMLEFEDDQYDCQSLNKDDSDTSAKKAALAMCLIGIVCILACVVIMVLHLTLCGLVEILGKLAAGCAFLASGFILIGVIVYGAKVHEDIGGDLSAGFGLCLTSSAICLIMGILCLFTD